MPNPLFAMDTWFYNAQGRYRPAARAAMLQELGYPGLNITLWDAQAWSDLPTMIEQADARHLSILGIYLGVDVAKPDVDPRWAEAFDRLRGRPALVELALSSSDESDKPGSPRGTARAADLVRRIADQASARGLRVALYHHIRCWLERVDHAVHLGMRINRDDVGLTFNLFHWLHADGADLHVRLELVMPKLWNVTINGCTRRGPGDCSIEPLDQGTFDLFPLLTHLDRLGYAGPLALQGYGIGGDTYAGLKRSLAAYRDLAARVARHPDWADLGPPVG